MKRSPGDSRIQPHFKLVEAVLKSGAFVGTRPVFEGTCSEVVERAASYERGKIVGVAVETRRGEGWFIEGWLKDGKAC